MSRLYLLNSPVLTDHGLWRLSGPLDGAQARALVRDGFISAIGHESTARVLGAVLGVEVPMSRVRISLAPGDRALVFRLKTRPPEGALLDEAALRAMDWELSLLERLE